MGMDVGRDGGIQLAVYAYIHGMIFGGAMDEAAMLRVGH
jgi:hypothetical protein